MSVDFGSERTLGGTYCLRAAVFVFVFVLAFNDLLLFVNPWCGHTLEDLRFDKCASGSSFNKELFSPNSRRQRQKLEGTEWPQGAADGRLGHQLSVPTALAVLAPSRHLTQCSLPFLPRHFVLGLFHQQVFILSSQNNLLVSTALLG